MEIMICWKLTVLLGVLKFIFHFKILEDLWTVKGWTTAMYLSTDRARVEYRDPICNNVCQNSGFNSIQISKPNMQKFWSNPGFGHNTNPQRNHFATVSFHWPLLTLSRTTSKIKMHSSPKCFHFVYKSISLCKAGLVRKLHLLLRVPLLK